ncbi:hypothetical protein BW723_12645 [Polaribacter reichenbachii]|uniref:DUF2141 domain-containing protein n=1 Tax=Polaribacter reichenbachii TaxID=996801 RepID=A0A1B8U080_9FLAO|nr:DUF2141 domain-containing protein [Polaribacter reichenbachii]APZ47079.1 hypothetical protein BW723_12645 [Polaribacter reichenbachii]AUC17720.1 hypothetical protein BTO17_03095 [Polaribacter reichenbachii]OBY65257.1 hypothetical protein LPB301_09125 [Polaribacter reichenbachii]
MKLIVSLLVATALFISSTITAQNKKITATVVNVTSDSGKVSFALYNKVTFMKAPIQAKNAKIVDGKSTVTFDNLEEGEYAIICFHDKNENNTMDFQPNGMPKEDYGASNNVMNFGPPSYENAKFVVTDKDVSLDIKF